MCCMQPTLGRLANITNKPEVMMKSGLCGWFVNGEMDARLPSTLTPHPVALRWCRVC